MFDRQDLEAHERWRVLVEEGKIGQHPVGFHLDLLKNVLERFKYNQEVV